MTAQTLQTELAFAFGGSQERAQRVLDRKPTFHRVERSHPSLQLWCILEVYPGSERKVKEALEEWGGEVREIEVKQYRRASRKVKRMVPYSEPLPGYVFADLTTWAHRQNIKSMIKMRKYINSILQRDGQNFLLNSVQFQALCDSLQDGSFDRRYLDFFNEFEKGEQLRATEGPFTGYTGKVESETDILVKVIIEGMGQAVPVELRKEDVERVA